ncbi:MAG: hypothetical protein AAGD43_33775 [Pseudomonadota bacterium]
MIGHKTLWDAAMKPRLDARARGGAILHQNSARFEPIELPFRRDRGRDGSSHSDSFQEKETLS